jgi:branched-chain amino acid transport system substrate-binding protein
MPRNKLFIAAIASAISAALLLTACIPGGAGDPNTIKFVSSMPRTGASKGLTDSIANGIKMALDEANNKAGSFTIRYDDLDDATAAKGNWDAAKEADNANRAVNDPQVMVYLGTFNSGAASVSIPIMCKANLAMLSPANSYPGLTKPGKGEADEPDKYYQGCKRNYSRVIPADDLQGVAGANWAKQDGAQRVYVLDDTELYGHGIATVFADHARRIDLQVVGGPDGIDPKASDYRAVAERIRATNPDLVFFGGVTANNAAKLAQDLKAAMPNVKFMAPDGTYDQAFLDGAGPAAEGAMLTFGGLPAPKLTGKGADFYKNYKDKYKIEPESYAAYGYEAARVALAAVAQAGRADRAAIRDAIMATKDFDGVLGRWSFDPNGDTNLTTMSGRFARGGKYDEANAVILQAS